MKLWWPWMGAACGVFLLGGCGGADGSGMAGTPEEAASQIEEAFAGSEGFTREAARAASEAMRKSEYERAVVSLQTMKAGTNITAEQGLAIHSSMVALEGELISAMAAGDKTAAQAYELLRALKRN